MNAIATAIERLRAEVKTAKGLAPLKVLSASGQLGYGVPEAAFNEGLKRQPHFIGADMGSIDPGPYYLGRGNIATSDAQTIGDLTMLLGRPRHQRAAVDRHRRLRGCRAASGQGARHGA